MAASSLYILGNGTVKGVTAYKSPPVELRIICVCVVSIYLSNFIASRMVGSCTKDAPPPKTQCPKESAPSKLEIEIEKFLLKELWDNSFKSF